MSGARWGKPTKSTHVARRGEVRLDPESHAAQVLLRHITGRGELGPSGWSFEITGPQGLYAKCSYTYKSEEAAMEAAEFVANALLQAPRPRV